MTLINHNPIKKSDSKSTNYQADAPVDSIPAIVATAECDTEITLSPFPIPIAFREISIASVPLATPSALLTPINLAMIFQAFVLLLLKYTEIHSKHCELIDSFPL